MRKFYLPLIALVAGFCLALSAAGVSSYFFILLPIFAFAFGYFSSWRLGLLCSLLLFGGYTFAISLVWWGIDNPNLLEYPLPYIAAFFTGGFGILLIGVLSPMVRKGIKGAYSIAVLVILTGMVGLCGYSAMPHYSYYYQVVIQSSENLNNLELYLPLGTVSGESYEELYNHVHSMPGYLTENFTREVVDTEQGKMLKITIPELKKEDVREPRYTANIIFEQKNVPNELIRLMPRYDAEQVSIVISQQFMGPIKSHESLVVERFNIPVKIMASSQAPIKLTLWNRTDRSEAVNFTYSRSYPYTELVNCDLTTGEEWVLVPVKATSAMEISGISD